MTELGARRFLVTGLTGSAGFPVAKRLAGFRQLVDNSYPDLVG